MKGKAQLINTFIKVHNIIIFIPKQFLLDVKLLKASFTTETFLVKLQMVNLNVRSLNVTNL